MDRVGRTETSCEKDKSGTVYQMLQVYLSYTCISSGRGRDKNRSLPEETYGLMVSWMQFAYYRVCHRLTYLLKNEPRCIRRERDED